MNEVWNLDPIYKGFDDPAFEADMAALKTEVENIVAFAQVLPGIAPVEGLKKGIALQEKFSELVSKLAGFASLRQAADTLEFQPSEKQINAELDVQMENLSAQLAQQGLNLEMYCQFMSTTEAQLREDARANAEASVRIQAAIEQIVYTENLEASEEEIGQAMAVIARQNRMTVEQLKPYVDAEFTAAVQRSVLTSKVMKLIRDAAEIEE